MNRDRSQFRVQIRRLSILSIRIFYRWICNHPFLLGVLCFLALLYRTCPLLFSLLLSASPVLVCTAVLLGTILSFGQPNIPEIEKEPEVVHEATPLKTEVSRDATVFERNDESFTVESFENRGINGVEDGNHDVGRLGESQASEVEEGSGSIGYRPLVDQSKRENQVRFEEKAFILESENEGEKIEEKLVEDDVYRVLGEEKQMKVGRSFEDMMNDSKEEQMDMSPVSPWRPMRHDEDGEDDADRDDSLDSGSDGAESSSPDASMTDITPMLDELHPLLHSDAPHTGNLSREGSDAASEGPHKSSSDEDVESGLDSEEHGEDGDNENADDDEDDDEEEETKEDKEDESKSAIKWTEDDQKNLMDLGSLELERNRRLENLVARRRARHNMRLMAERNLIDLDCVDIPFNMPNISTARLNPFDLPYESHDDMGLPPIPGSAPSILLPRRNPFDIPYAANEEKPDLKRDSFQEEFSPLHPKEPVFRRHESFNVGPSMFGGLRQDRHDRLRPYFMPERSNEGTSYYNFERQLSEISESKVSSVPDSESVSTGMEEDDKKVNGHDCDREPETPNVDPASDHDEQKSDSSEDFDSDGQANNKNNHHDVAEITLGGVESFHEEQSNTREEVETRDTREPVEEYSESESPSSDKEEKKHSVRDEELSMSLEPIVDHAEETSVPNQPQIRESEVHLAEKVSMSLGPRVEHGEEAGIPTQPQIRESEMHPPSGVEDVEGHREAPAEGSFDIAQPSLQESEIHTFCGLEDYHNHKEPVYDASPRSASRLPSFSSVSSDNQDSPGNVVDQVGETKNKEPEVYSKSVDLKTSGIVGANSGSAEHAPDETESRTREVGEIGERVVRNINLFASDAGRDGQNDSMISESLLEHASVDPFPLPLDKDGSIDRRENHMPLSGPSQEVSEEIHEDVKETVDAEASDKNVSSGDSACPPAEEAISAVADEHVPTLHTWSHLDTEHTSGHETALEETCEVVQDKAETSGDGSVPDGIMHKEEEARDQKGQTIAQTFDADITIDSYSTLSSGAVEYVEAHSFNDEDIMHSEQEQVRSSISDAKEDTHLNQAVDVEVDSVNAVDQSVRSEETSPSESDKELTWSDKSVVEQSTPEHSEPQEPTETSRVGVVFARNVTFHEYHDAEGTADMPYVMSDTSSPLAESPEYETPMLVEGSRAGFFDNTVYEELDHVSDHRLDQSRKLHATSHIPPEVIIEEADEIKEIDEGLLSELDTVGDFSVKDVVTNSEAGTSARDSDIVKETTEVVPPIIPEARSVEDIESAVQQIHKGTEINEVIPPSHTDDQLALERSVTSDETNSDLTLVEARSLEDIETAMMRVSGEMTSEQPKSPESEDGSAEIKYPVETKSSPSRIKDSCSDDTHSSSDNMPEEEVTKPSDTQSVEVRTLKELPETSGPKESTAEVKSESPESSNLTSNEQSHDNVTKVKSKETSENPSQSSSEQKGKGRSKSGSSSEF